MEQVYLPKIDTLAIAGWCLKYIDDAGNAPNRTATARYSWEVERDAGRIRNSDIPENVWVVGWLDFTAGMYQTYGHVFFIKRNGSNYEIHDSEVHSGARKPYKSIDELLAWFGAYKPIYTGWSTHCDGREYAKLRSEIMSREQLIWNYRLIGGYDPSEAELQGWLQSGKTYETINEEMKRFFHNGGGSYILYKEKTEKEIKALNDQIEQLKKQVSGEFVPVGELFAKVSKK